MIFYSIISLLLLTTQHSYVITVLILFRGAPDPARYLVDLVDPVQTQIRPDPTSQDRG